MDQHTQLIVAALTFGAILVGYYLWNRAHEAKARRLVQEQLDRAAEVERLHEEARQARQFERMQRANVEARNQASRNQASRTPPAPASRSTDDAWLRRQYDEDDARRRRDSDNAFYQHQAMTSQSAYSTPEPSCSSRSGHAPSWGCSSSSSDSSSSSSDSGSCSSSD